MPLTPSEADHLLLFTQAQLAQQRRDRGLRLNVPEATALIAHQICEWARDGRDLATVRQDARSVLSSEDVLPEVPGVVTQIKVEARFDDGTRLVVVTNPFGAGSNDELLQQQDLTAPESVAQIQLRNCADIDIGITSHMHLAEVNPRIRLDRESALGMRLALPTGDTLLLAPGEIIEIGMVPITGDRIIIGNSGLIDGPVDDPAVRARAIADLRRCGYLDSFGLTFVGDPTSVDLNRAELAAGAALTTLQQRRAQSDGMFHA